MPCSLESLLAQPATQYTKSVIQAGLRTPGGEKTIWIVTEDYDDVKVYESFFEKNKTKILPSSYEVDGHEQKGCSFLEKIVDEILNEEDNPYIIGIRDTDYTKYEDPVHTFPKNIFHTDHRDVEMMLLSAQSVLDGLKTWNPLLIDKLEEGKAITRKLGYMRICNYLYSLGCSFKRKVKISKVWDSTTHVLRPEWEDILMNAFLNNCGNQNLSESFTEEKFNQVIKEKGLEQESYLDICQGHDTIKLLQYMMINVEYNEDYIMERMPQYYSLADIQQTQLYASLKEWESQNELSILN